SRCRTHPPSSPLSFPLPPAPRPLPSSPTRRSSDLVPPRRDEPLAVLDHPERVRGHHVRIDVPCQVAEGDHGVLLVGEEYTVIARSEEHTSELQSRGHLVCRLLLEKKKKNKCEVIIL